MKGGKNFNKIIANCVKDIEITNNKEYRYTYNSEKDYLNSIKSKVKGFSLTATEKKSIDCIIYNNKNNDGHFAAAIAYHYVKTEGKTDAFLIRNGEGIKQLNRVIKNLNNKTVLILDLEYDSETYERLSKTCKKVFTIDDHKKPDVSMLKNVKVFSSEHTHGTIAFAWEVFYPKKKIPKIVQLVDMGDSKKYGKFISYSNFVSTALAFRYMQNPRIKRSKWNSGEALDDIWSIIQNDNDNIWIIMGAYMDEVQENIKEQIARNAVIKNFQGYKVGVLNFSDPVLTKRIGRQICSNLGDKIDFALLWAYEHNKDVYRIQIIIDHNAQKKIDMGNIARQMAKAGGTEWGGGGHPNVGNFYWPKGNGKDIWDIFHKNYL
jgi:oligoribonuclease NrnB/cAMP/cGMP phosphodiesterase (DHH superfamily)